MLGAIGGYLQDVFVGAAPDADFYLYRSENAAVEIPEEELYWIEAAEEADRKGVEIITSSLGYNVLTKAVTIIHMPIWTGILHLLPWSRYCR